MRVELPVSADEFIALRDDIGFDHFCATMENQVLKVDVRTTDDGTVHRIMSKSLKENPVPPLLRSLAPAELEFATEERFNPRRYSSGSPMVISARLPGSLSELVTIESQQWVESIDGGRRCAVCSQHEITARVRGFSSTIEKRLEQQIRAGYESLPSHVALYLPAPTLRPSRRLSATSRSSEDVVIAVDVRRRLSVVSEEVRALQQPAPPHCTMAP